MLSMPHAVAFDRPFDSLPHRQLTLPLPKTSLPPLGSNPQYQRTSYTSSIPTPPTEMSYGNSTALPSFSHSQSTFPAPGTSWQNGCASTYARAGQAVASRPVSSQRPSRDYSVSRSRPGSPSQRSYIGSESGHKRKTSPNNAIAATLRIPDTISTPQSGIPQLAAEITCLFWFESSTTLQQVLKSTSPNARPGPLVSEAIPSTGFRKWVATILSTTQVAQNVILLALLFIYRLKKTNPTVKGKIGSEYRLLTVALMLGNKFLDDNTYTNKTWAEVSGISVQEVHIMEVEFLSNMRYSLFTSEKEWNDWHVTLGKFGTFFERASRANLEMLSRPVGPPTPTVHIQPTLPSPPTSNGASPPFTASHSPNGHLYNSHTPLLLPQVGSTVVSPIGPLPELDIRPSRKRSYDDGHQGPPPKRAQYQYQYPPPSTSISGSSISQSQMQSNLAPTLPRLPNLSVSLTQPLQHSSPAAPQLPPPGNRAMSLVYPPPVQWQSHAVPTGAPLHGPALPQILPPAISQTDPSRQLSPFPISAGTSPVNHSGQSRLSPSHFLQQRQSPYRPVRNVQTLLYPPPTTSIQNPSKNISYDQMQYQPLGRPMTERRAGTLPYMHHEAWPQTNQFNQYPVLPQPNFSRG